MIERIQENWNNGPELEKIQLEIISKQLDLSEDIEVKLQNINSTFLLEKEDGYKMNDSVAKARAKAAHGTTEGLQYRFDAYTNMLHVVTLRISQIQNPLAGGVSSQRHPSASTLESSF